MPGVAHAAGCALVERSRAALGYFWKERGAVLVLLLMLQHGVSHAGVQCHAMRQRG